MSREISRLLMACCLAVCLGCDHQDPDFNNYYVKYYGENGSQEGIDMVVNEEEDVIMMLGASTWNELRRIFLVKTDLNGNLKWSKTIGSSNDKPIDLEPLQNGGFVILSETFTVSNDLDVKLIVIDAAGNKTDSVVYGSPAVNGQYADEHPRSVTVLDDNGFIVTGGTGYSATWASPTNTDESDVFQYRFTAALDPFGPLWGDEYANQSNFDIGVKTVQLRDSRFYVFAHTLHSLDGANEDDFNLWFYPKGDDSGNIGYLGTDAAGNNEVLTAVCPNFRGGYALVGTFSTSLSGNNPEIYLAQLNAVSGELVKGSGERKITILDNTDRRSISPVSVCQSHAVAQGYLIAGNEGSGEVKNIWISKINESGDVLWSAVLGSERKDDRAGTIFELQDGKIIVLGTVTLEVNNAKMALIKLNSSGKLAN